MTPEELAKYRAEKLQKDADAAAAKKATADANAARQRAEAEAVKRALVETVIPYFTKVRTAMGNGMSFAPVIDTDNEIVGVDLQVDGKAAKMQASGQIMMVSIIGSQQALPMTYSAIRNLRDITEENLSTLIKDLIDNK